MGITNNLDSTRSFTFSYDQLNRISTAATSSGSAAYAEDIWGNLYSVSLTGSPAWQNGLSQTVLNNNRFASEGYDAAGNMTSDGVYSYSYDAEERQTSAAGVTYGYDGDGKRVEKVASKIYWYGLGSEPLLETDWGGNLQNEYVFLGGSRIARRDSGSNVYYYLGDHLGSSHMIFTSSGSRCYDADFGPYGKEAVYTSTCAQNYKFTGKERDAETGNDYFGARFYENNLGRFTSPESAPPNLFDPQSLNKYTYVRNNPLQYVDPSGQFYKTIHEDITNRTLARLGYSGDVARSIAVRNAEVDDHFNDEAHAFMHAQARRVTVGGHLHQQSAEEARREEMNFVRAEIGSAAWQVWHGTFANARYLLGQAFHAVQDEKHQWTPYQEHTGNPLNDLQSPVGRSQDWTDIHPTQEQVTTAERRTAETEPVAQSR